MHVDKKISKKISETRSILLVILEKCQFYKHMVKIISNHWKIAVTTTT